MILIYVPAASLLAPYYENERDITQKINKNDTNEQIFSNEMELFNPLQSKIVDDYTAFSRFIHGIN